MLSRIAESLYWMGRYVERAEDTARILDVHVHRRLEDPSVEEEAACRAVLGVMGVKAGRRRRATPTSMLETLAFRMPDTTSIAGALSAARENARGARDAISSEMWECLNATHNALPAMVAQAAAIGPHGLFAYVKERAAILSGLADSTMSRDDGWRFLVLGRSLERVDMTARMLSAGLHDAEEPGDWVATLRCCSAHEAFLRTYRRAVTPDLVAEFLLLDRLFPRSAFHALGVAETVPGRAPAPRGPGRARRRGPAGGGPGPHRPRVPPPAGAGGRPPRPPALAADRLPRGGRRGGPPLLPPGGAPRVEPARAEAAAR